MKAYNLIMDVKYQEGGINNHFYVSTVFATKHNVIIDFSNELFKCISEDRPNKIRLFELLEYGNSIIISPGKIIRINESKFEDVGDFLDHIVTQYIENNIIEIEINI